MKIIEDYKYGFDDVLIVPKRSTLESRKDVSLHRKYYFYHSPREYHGVPIFCANMASIAGLDMAKALYSFGMSTALHKYIDDETMMEAVQYNGFMSIGMNDKDLNKLQDFLNRYNYQPNLCIDVPNAYLEKFVKHCARVRELCPESIIMAGNVVTPEMTQELIIHGGVDIVKIGIGPGSKCQTKFVTGVSYPQVSAAIECSMVAHGLKSDNRRNGLICLDGGFKHIGDLAKGFVAGSDFCMTGSMFAGCQESCGEWENGRLKHYGMSSHYAQQKHEGVNKLYRASEGTVDYIDAKGPVEDIIREILGGLRSTATYIGALELRDFSKCGQFIKVLK